MYDDKWPPYVSVAQRRAGAAREIAKLRQESRIIEPVEIQGRKIARTFWGQAWCAHLEHFSDYANRLPRGRTYVCNGSVWHLAIKPGSIEAMVAGSALYQVNIQIAPLSDVQWEQLRRLCSGQIGSLLELLQGRLSQQVMEIVSDPEKGLFPKPKDIKLACDCPDGAYLCKHLAAVLYGVGARLDKQPELLFVLRKVDYLALISANLDMQAATGGAGTRRRLTEQDISGVFGIDIDETEKPAKPRKGAPPEIAARTARPIVSEKLPVGSGQTIPEKLKAPTNSKPFNPTGAAVARLRKQLKLTRIQFAYQLGVSPQTIMKWESCRGPLKLQQRSLMALTQAWSGDLA